MTVVASVLVQLAGCCLLFAGQELHPQVAFSGFLVMDGVGAVVAGWLLAREISYHTGLSVRASVIAFFSLVSFFLPVIGPIGLAASMVAPQGRKKTSIGRPQMRRTALPALPARPLQAETKNRFGPGALAGILAHHCDANARLRVIVACRTLPGREAVPLLRLGLKDGSDEIRLLSYAILDGRERALYAEIKNLAGKIDANEQPAALHGRLAELYWELAYQELAQGEVLDFVLGRTLTHAAQARTLGFMEPRLALVMGRAYLLKHQSGDATAMLHEAARLGLPEQIVNPYLAEAAFQAGHFGAVKVHMAALARSDLGRPVIGDVMAQWT